MDKPRPLRPPGPRDGPLTDELETWLAARRPTPLEGTDDEINARWQQEDSALSLEEARRQAWKTFERRLRAIEAVPPDQWEPLLEEVAREDDAKHYAVHRNFVVEADSTVSQKGNGE